MHTRDTKWAKIYELHKHAIHQVGKGFSAAQARDTKKEKPHRHSSQHAPIDHQPHARKQQTHTHIQELLPEPYDVVISADSIYNERSIPRLVSLLSKCLRVGGIGSGIFIFFSFFALACVFLFKPLLPWTRSLVAAKESYAGVGGTVMAFQEHVEAARDTLHLDSEQVFFPPRAFLFVVNHNTQN